MPRKGLDRGWCAHCAELLVACAVQVEDLHDGDTLVTSISTNLTVGAAQAPAMSSPAPNMTVVTIRSAESVADIVKYNMTACMVKNPAQSVPNHPLLQLSILTFL